MPSHLSVVEYDLRFDPHVHQDFYHQISRMGRLYAPGASFDHLMLELTGNQILALSHG